MKETVIEIESETGREIELETETETETTRQKQRDRDMDNETSYYAGSVAISDIVGLPFDVAAFAGRDDNSDMDAGITLGNSFIDDKINVSYSWTWSETDVEDSSHSIGVFYTF